jgi:hypothetical protein
VELVGGMDAVGFADRANLLITFRTFFLLVKQNLDFAGQGIAIFAFLVLDHFFGIHFYLLLY